MRDKPLYTTNCPSRQITAIQRLSRYTGDKNRAENHGATKTGLLKMFL